jgi:hypothetical protein
MIVSDALVHQRPSHNTRTAHPIGSAWRARIRQNLRRLALLRSTTDLA